jgi:HEAT repeat protein
MYVAGPTPAKAQGATVKTQDANGKSQSQSANADGTVVGDQDEAPAALPANATPEQRNAAAWKLLDDALADAKRPQTRIEALAALGLLSSPRAETMITNAMKDPDVDVRTAAALAAGLTKDRNLTTPLRNLLDDKEPQVAFTAAITLWKMNDKSGEDVLMAVVNGDRKAGPDLIHGTEHSIYKELHDPAAMAKIGATEGATLLLGPFGFGVTAYEYIHKNGGNPSRVSAIEAIAQERLEPVHKELVAALGDKDPAVRAAAAKALVEYRDKATSMAVYALLADPKLPVRLTSAGAYLRTTGVPGPAIVTPVHAAKAGH